MTEPGQPTSVTTPSVSESREFSFEGTLNVEEWLTNNRLKKLIPKFTEDEIMIEELIQLAENEHNLKKYAIDTLKISDQMYLQRFMNAVTSSRIKFLAELNNDNIVNIGINGTLTPIDDKISLNRFPSTDNTTVLSRKSSRRHKRTSSLGVALRSAPTIVKIHVVVTEEETNLLKMLGMQSFYI